MTALQFAGLAVAGQAFMYVRRRNKALHLIGQWLREHGYAGSDDPQYRHRISVFWWPVRAVVSTRDGAGSPVTLHLTIGEPCFGNVFNSRVVCAKIEHVAQPEPAA